MHRQYIYFTVIVQNNVSIQLARALQSVFVILILHANVFS